MSEATATSKTTQPQHATNGDAQPEGCASATSPDEKGSSEANRACDSGTDTPNRPKGPGIGATRKQPQGAGGTGTDRRDNLKAGIDGQRKVPSIDETTPPKPIKPGLHVEATPSTTRSPDNDTDNPNGPKQGVGVSLK